MLRHLFLVGYDISSARRRRRVLRSLKGHAVGGQKSLYECWFTVAELQAAMAQMEHLMDPATDRAVFVQLDTRALVHGLGRAVPAPADDFFYLG
ncbi:CRISPR-associated endonuclease Cas2 [Roseateles sp.]|uniref:CRISPR-associated endonuclease Cas2 n=1 Tax=Roseateles sp. TaxID=1971397 RepID=UPI00286B0918|nr:CRISPR-associated endonuclease Cas2 [Roseateles sp.]